MHDTTEVPSSAAIWDSTPSEICLETRISSCRSRINELQGIKRKVGIVRMWPDQAVAEHENIERFRVAFDLLGVRLIEIDRYGIIINSPNQQVTSDDVDFVIHLHFETSKTYDVTSVAAMWNPTAFYFEWGFERFWSNQMTHDLFAHTGSEEIIGLMRSTRGSVDLEKMPLLNHSLAEPIIAPQLRKDYRVFYCGINWEVISGKQGRHDAVLKALDAADILDIYGPKTLQGKSVWAGFKGYQHPLPFDGKTIIEKIAAAGACLVFSSEAHIQSNIMSNRLFEALAAGAVVFGDEHPFIKQAIGDNYILVNSSLPAEKRAEIIVSALSEFQTSPEKAFAMAKAAQQAFIANFFFCDQLVGVYEAAHRHRILSETRLESLAEPVIDLVIQPIIDDARLVTSRLRSLHAALKGKGRIILLVPRIRKEWFVVNFSDIAEVVAHDRGKAILAPFECLNLVRDRVVSKKVCFLLGIEEIFAQSLLNACLDLGDSRAGRLAHVLMHIDAENNLHYDGRGGGLQIEDLHEAAMACAIYETAWLKSKPPLASLGWRDICRMAEIEDEGVVEHLGTALTVHLKDYENALHMGMRWNKSVLDAWELVKVSTQIKSIINGAAVLRRVDRGATVTEFRNLSGRTIVAEIRQLPRNEKWGLTLDLYNSVPFPGWVRKLIAGLRRAVGIR